MVVGEKTRTAKSWVVALGSWILIQMLVVHCFVVWQWVQQQRPVYDSGDSKDSKNHHRVGNSRKIDHTSNDTQNHHAMLRPPSVNNNNINDTGTDNNNNSSSFHQQQVQQQLLEMILYSKQRYDTIQEQMQDLIRMENLITSSRPMTTSSSSSATPPPPPPPPQITEQQKQNYRHLRNILVWLLLSENDVPMTTTKTNNNTNNNTSMTSTPQLSHQIIMSAVQELQQLQSTSTTTTKQQQPPPPRDWSSTTEMMNGLVHDAVAVAAVVTNSRPSASKSQNGNGSNTTDTTTCSSSIPHFVTYEHLKTRIDQIRSDFATTTATSTIGSSSSSKSTLPLSFSSTISTLQRILQKQLYGKWNETILYTTTNDNINKSHNNSSTTVAHSVNEGTTDGSHNHKNCLPSSSSSSSSRPLLAQILHGWIDAGFDAMYRNENPDIRRALLQSMQQQTTNDSWVLDVSNVRLDIPLFVTQLQAELAMLQHQPPTTGGDIRQQRLQFSNVRQYIDSPQLYEWFSYIDVVLDCISGRNDLMDDLMDQYIYNNNQLVSSSSSSSCGNGDTTTTTTTTCTDPHEEPLHPTTTIPPNTTTTTTTQLIGPILASYVLNLLGHVPIPQLPTTTMTSTIFKENNPTTIRTNLLSYFKNVEN